MDGKISVHILRLFLLMCVFVTPSGNALEGCFLDPLGRGREAEGSI